MIRLQHLTLLALASTACAASHTDWTSAGRPAAALPPQFQPDPAFPPPADTSGACLVRLVDPRDGTRLTLAQSDAGDGRISARGDYEVEPAGRYQLRAGERLRIDCRARRAIGIVRR